MSAGLLALAGALLAGALLHAASWAAPEAAKPLPGAEDCMACHEAGPPLAKRDADTPPRFDAAGLRASPHAKLACTACHADLEGKEFPHETKPAPVRCGACHATEQQQFVESLHGQAAARGEKLAPSCKDCHGRHDVLPRSDPRSPTNTVNVPALCGRCHHEGSPVQLTYHIPQDSILAELLRVHPRRGAVPQGPADDRRVHLVPHRAPRAAAHRPALEHRAPQRGRRPARSATCASSRCTARSSTACCGRSRPNAIPACVDCHQPHKARRVFYTQGMADRDCLTCHGRRDLQGAGRRARMFVDTAELQGSRHAKIACAQCHSEAQPSHARPCSTITRQVDCSVCHAEVVDTYRKSTHGQLAAKGSPDAPACRDCHGTHGIQGHLQSDAPTYARNVPALCGRCHLSGKQAAGALPRDGAPGGGVLRREHPRQGAARERAHRDRDLRGLPHHARRAAARPTRRPA